MRRVKIVLLLTFFIFLRVILDQEIKTDRLQKGAPMNNLRAFHYLKENGVPASFDSLTKRTHAKLLIIDEETVIVGSTNWSREALDENYEAGLLVRSTEIAIYYGKAIDFEKKEFEAASYVPLPFYDPKVRGQKLKKARLLAGMGRPCDERGDFKKECRKSRALASLSDRYPQRMERKR